MCKKHFDVSSVLALVKIVVASQHKRQRKKSLTWKAVRSLHYANELVLRVRLGLVLKHGTPERRNAETPERRNTETRNTETRNTKLLKPGTYEK